MGRQCGGTPEKNDGRLPWLRAGAPRGAAQQSAADTLLSRAYLKPAARAAGVPWVTNHTLRHTFCTQSNRNGVPITLLSEIMGHHSAAFTLSRYVTLFRSDVVGIDMSWQDVELLPEPCQTEGTPLIQAAAE